MAGKTYVFGKSVFSFLKALYTKLYTTQKNIHHDLRPLYVSGTFEDRAKIILHGNWQHIMIIRYRMAFQSSLTTKCSYCTILMGEMMEFPNWMANCRVNETCLSCGCSSGG